MYTPRRAVLTRGASVLAALVLASIVGVGIFTVQTLAPKVDTRAYNSDAQVQTAAAADTKTGTNRCPRVNNDECVAGEVHTVNMTGGANSCVQQKGVACWRPDPENPDRLIRDPAMASNPACRDSNQRACVVRYCPPREVTAELNKPAGTCIVINCSGNGTDTTGPKSPDGCLRGALNTASGATNLDGYNNLIDFSESADTVPRYSVPLDARATAALDAAFTQRDRIDALSDQIGSQTAECPSTGICRVQVDRQLAEAAGLRCETTTGTGVGGSCVVDANQAQQTLSEQNDRLNRQIDRLRASGIVAMETPLPPCSATLTTNCTGEGGVVVPPATGCPAGQIGTPPTCRPTTVPPPQMPPPGPGQRLPPNGTGFGSGLGGLGNLFGGGTGMGQPLQSSPFYQLGRMIGGLITGNNGTQGPFSCATNQDQYYQQQQQYNQMLQQYQYQYQQYQYQQYYSQSYYGVQSSAITAPPRPPQLPQPCYNNQTPQQCQNSPQQPPASNCSSGRWMPTTSGTGCISNWQCIPNNTGGTDTGGTSGPPSAELRCQPQVADVGMSLAISWGCANSATSVGNGFDTNGALSGSATTTIQTPPGTTNTATYSLTCTKEGVTAGAQCRVQIGRPVIVIIANPKQVQSGKAATIGWITSGMRSCVISSADLPEFTLESASNTSVNGVATTPPLTASATFKLHCTTQGGGTKDAETTVTVQ